MDVAVEAGTDATCRKRLGVTGATSRAGGLTGRLVFDANADGLAATEVTAFAAEVARLAP